MAKDQSCQAADLLPEPMLVVVGLYTQADRSGERFQGGIGIG